MRSVPRLTILDSVLIVVAFLPLTQRASTATDTGPQGVIGQFCQADALGQRASVQGWQTVVPLVGWSFEPAWDEVVLIAGYSIGLPQAAVDGVVRIAVRYDVLSTVSALGVDASPRVETVTFRLRTADGMTWRIDGPPPPPHILGPRVDVDIMRQSLQFGGVNFLADSVFVAQMFRSAGWDVGLKRVADLLDGTLYGAVQVPQSGDLVVYLRDGTPYHVGLLEGENQVVSSTLNAGILRTSTNAFAGEVRYLRLLRPENLVAEDSTLGAPPTPASLKPTIAAGAVVRRTGAKPARTPRPVQRPHKQLRKKKLPVRPARHHTPKPSASRRTKKPARKAATRPLARSTQTAPHSAQ